MKSISRAALAALALFLLASCAPRGAAGKAASIAVFVPGVVSGSPIYEQLVAGARAAAESLPGSTVKVVEAGFNQSEWLDKLSALAATGEYSLIVTSNPAMPELCAKVAESFPKARFFVADGFLAGNPAIHTVLYDQFQQGYIVGYLAGLVTTASLPGSNPAKKAGLVVAQRYPTLDEMIEPGFRAGLEAAAPGSSLAVRVVGNWYDANKAAELATGLIDEGADILLPIAGGAGQGVVSAAKAKGRYALWFDGDGYALAPEVVLGCAVVRQERLVAESVKALLGKEGGALYGTARTVGATEGYVDFDDSGAAYRALPEALRGPFEAMVARLRSGALVLPAGAGKR